MYSTALHFYVWEMLQPGLSFNSATTWRVNPSSQLGSHSVLLDSPRYYVFNMQQILVLSTSQAASIRARGRILMRHIDWSLTRTLG
jgi:hypothetical protein